MFTAWPDIVGFHQIRSHTQDYPPLLRDVPTVTYRPKIKLHGTNAGIRFEPDGTIVAQSREKDLTGGADNAGFAAWVRANEGQLQEAARLIKLQGWVLFGEWCGPGVNKGTAIQQINHKIFAVFGASRIRTQEAESDDFLDAPEEFQTVADLVKTVHVLPWAGPTISVNWVETDEGLSPITDEINQQILAVEACDPWVKATFGIDGLGEGLVYYPVSPTHRGRKGFSELAFKAKGEKHRVAQAARAAQVAPVAAETVDAFVAMTVTEARLDQGARAVLAPSEDGEAKFSRTHIGPFIGWVAKDVEKETQTELRASGLTWKQVGPAVQQAARKWYLEKVTHYGN